MSASLIPTLDRENAGAHLGTHDKHHLIGSQRKHGELQTRTLPVQKQFGGISTNLQKSHRSFGEIGNRLDRGSETSHSGIFKKSSQPPLSTASIPEVVQKEISEEPEFIQSIPVLQDYSDIFPASLCMSHNQLKEFACFWESCQKPDLHTLNSSWISSSPPRDLTLLPVVKYDEKVILEPVPEDLFHLPPPWE